MRQWNILNLGAGVQSTAVYLMACDVKLWGPNLLDFAIFADTGDEPEEVYRHLKWLQSIGTVPIMIRTKGRLSDHLRTGTNSTGGRFASIPAFTGKHEGKPATGMVQRQCSKEYKIEVIERAIRRDIIGLEPRQRIPKDVHVNQYYGISLDESGRANRIEHRAKKQKWVTVKFPLLALNMTRADCLTYLKDKVPHQVPRSACVFCPYHNDAEWVRIQSNPRDWKLAVEIDEALRKPGIVFNRNLNQKLYLHNSCKPLVQIKFNPRPPQREIQMNLRYAQECLGVCGV